MDRKQELGFLKCELQNKIDGMLVAYAMLDEEEKKTFSLFQRCMSVFSRIVEFDENDYKELVKPTVWNNILEKMDDEYESALCDFAEYAESHDLTEKDDMFHTGMKRAMEIVMEGLKDATTGSN